LIFDWGFLIGDWGFLIVDYMSEFSHLDEAGRPNMVDVSAKADTVRIARAQARIELGPEIMEQLAGADFVTAKGSIIQTAIIAATMAVKNTAQTIPLCHNIPIQSVKTHIEPVPGWGLHIECRVKTTGPTGVEMEALHGASVAALTIYDMCKALSQRMVIHEVLLLEKTGGKQDYVRQAHP
jgi:cyclic pyranopterin phosphate synthase